MLSNSFLHWLGSHSFFALYIYHFFIDGFQYENDLNLSSTLDDEAMSSAASVALLSIRFSLLLTQIAVGFRSFDAGLMPLGANCSAAISATYHLHPLETDAASRIVRSGFVDTWSERASPETEVVDLAQHLTFLSM